MICGKTWAAALSEFVGGALLVFGLCARPAAFFMAFTMGVAAFQFHKVAPVIDTHIAHLYFWVFVLFMLAGPGEYSLDGWFRRAIPDKRTRWSWRIGLVALLAAVGVAIAATRPLPPATAAELSEVTQVLLMG